MRLDVLGLLMKGFMLRVHLLLLLIKKAELILKLTQSFLKGDSVV